MASSFLFSAPRAWTFISLIAFFVFIPCIYSFPLAAATDEGAGSTSYVLTLDATNFSEVVAKNRFVVVEFYAPWCGHCKRLAPEYEKAAVTLSKHDPPILLAKVDANDEGNKDLASKYGIRGYPTIKIFRDEGHNIQEYKGPRDADGIVEYLTKQAGPASVEITSSEDAKKFIDENKIFIVGIFSKFSGEEFDNFITVAEKLRSDYDFGHTLETKFLPKGVYNVEKPVVRLMKPFDELFVDSQDFRLESLEEFIAKASTPLVTLFTKDPNNHPYVKNFFSSGNAKAMLFLNFSSENVGDFKLKYKEVAENFRNKNISFLLGDIDSSQSAFRFFGLREEQVPLIIVQASDGQKFLKANLNPKDIATWFMGYMDGNLKPYRKSESIPDLNNDPVKVIVADNIDDVVFNSGKNVFVELYAPWCGHCQKLAPILDDVAVSFVNDPSVVIAKMDATANDVPRRFKIEGFPTLYLSTPSGSLLQYNGRRTKEDIVEFIQKHRESTMEPDSLKDEL